MNYFISEEAAARYAKGRPHFHHNTVAHIKNFLAPEKKLDRVLDVACGTGLSTRALLAIASDVYGTDSSTAMLRFASKDENIHYAVARAEQQPFPDHFFALITVSSAVHWFAIDDFLQEANRLLKPGGSLVLYENHFIAEMENKPSFHSWFFDSYLKKFPSPPRHNAYDWTNSHLNKKNFRLVSEEKFKNAVSFNKQELALYFGTQSNIIAAIESGKTTYPEASNWLLQALSAFFDHDDTRQTIHFGNWIKFLQKID